MRANMASTPEDGQKPFIGIAISGGGSRAAVFGWSVLKQLDDLQLLSDVDALSSVSGGSLAATLFALKGDTIKTAVEWDSLGKQISHDFLGDWLRRMLNPINWLRMASDGLTRTEVMSEVFDDVLFDRKTFADLGPPGVRRPSLFINATSATDPSKARTFVFDQSVFFRYLGSRLDTLPLSHAVIASGAFPGLFGSVPLRNFREALILPGRDEPLRAKFFEQVYDGGPSDNLGVWTLLRRARERYQASVQNGTPMRACLLVVVDAYAADYSKQLRALNAETDSSIVDLLVKPAAWNSIDAMLNANRLKTLAALGLASDVRDDPFRDAMYVPVPVGQSYQGETYMDWGWRPHYEPIARVPLFGPKLPWEWSRAWAELDGSLRSTVDMSDVDAAEVFKRRAERTKELERGAPECLVWHVAFDRLASLSDYVLKNGTVFRYGPVDSTKAFRRDFERGPVALESPPDTLGGTSTFTRISTKAQPPVEQFTNHDSERDVLAINELRLALWSLSTSVQTSYRLVGPKDCSEGFIRDALDLSATVLTREDRSSLLQVCSWYREQGLPHNCDETPISKTRANLAEKKWYTSIVETTTGRKVPVFACRDRPTKEEVEKALETLSADE